MPRVGAYLSILLAFAFLALAFSPVLQPARAETDWAVVGGGAAVGAASGALIGTAIADGPGAIAGAVVGGVWGAIAGYMAQDRQDAAFLNAKEAYAEALKNATTNYIGLASTSADNMISTYDLQTYFFARKAEWAALQLYNEQTNASASHVYDPYYVLSKSEVANGTIAAEWAIAAQYEAILNQYKDQSSNFIGTYEGMAWGYCSGTSSGSVGNIYQSTINSNPVQVAKVFLRMGEPTASGDFVTISAGTPIYIVAEAQGWNPVITIKDRDGNLIVNQTFSDATQKDVLVLNVTESGDYDITSSSAHVSVYGLFSKPITNAASLSVEIVSFTPKEDGSLTEYGNGINGIYFYGTGYQVVDISVMKSKVAAIVDKVQSMQTTANNLAQAYYNTLVSEGGGDNRIMPDIIFPDPAALENMTAEQIYAIYLAYLTQQQEWFKDYSVMDSSNVNISQESLHLKVRGSIYFANGTLMYSNTTIFTPYVSLDDMHLVIGRNDMTQPGFAMIWGSASSLADLDRLSDLKYVSLAAGDYFVIEEMALDNEPVSSADLTVTTVQYVVYDEFDPITPPQGASDAEWLIAHWYWFVIAFGAVFLIAGAFVKNWVIAIIGILMVAVGAIGWVLADSSWTGGLLSGLFQIRGGP